MTEPGTLLAGRYRLLERLARGGMGAVWRARDETLQRDVAVKVLHAQAVPGGTDAELAAERARREARTTAKLHHPNAVPVFDVVEHDGRPCLVMQYLPSRSLQAVLDDTHRLPPDRVAQLGAEIAGALAAAHRIGIIHRDVKPANVLVTEDGTAKLTDFGISHTLGDASLTSVGFVTGTPAYLAPEVARGGSAGFASDVHSLGATLYRAVEGTPPYGSDPNAMAVMHRVASGRFTPPTPGSPLGPLLERMLAVDPAARPPMHNVALALRDLAVGTRTGQGSRSGPPTAGASGRTRVVSAGPPRPAPTSAVPTGSPPRPAAAPHPAGPAHPGGPPRPAGPPTRTSVRPGPPPSTPAVAPEPRRRRRGAWVAAVVVTLLLAGGVVAYALTRPDGTSQADAPASASAPPASTGAPAATDTPPAADTPSDTPTPSTAATGTPTAAELAAAISSYYTLVPGDTDAAWQLLTSDYQTGQSGGRDGYDEFWGSITSVTASDVTGTPPGTAVATLAYVFADGSTSTERTSFELVREDGVLKIASSDVLSKS